MTGAGHFGATRSEMTGVRAEMLHTTCFGGAPYSSSDMVRYIPILHVVNTHGGSLRSGSERLNGYL
jgi:hypothetical protein